jgi:hypothetical protein
VTSLAWRRSDSSAAATSCILARRIAARAMRSKSHPGVTRGECTRRASRIRRLARLRATAPPTCLLAVTPTRNTPNVLRRATSTSNLCPHVWPSCRRRSKSVRARRRCAPLRRACPEWNEGSDLRKGCHPDFQLMRLARLGCGAISRRPLARRALSTLRPPLVAIRARKPCTRCRCRFLG